MGEIFHGFDEAEPLGHSELDREGLTSLFDRYEWFKRTHAECPVAGVPLIARASANGINSWLFLSKENGGKATGLASWYTLAFRPVFRGNDDAIIRMELLQNIARKLRNQVSHIELSPMHEAECNMTARAFRQAGWIAIEQVTGCNWTFKFILISMNKHGAITNPFMPIDGNPKKGRRSFCTKWQYPRGSREHCDWE